MGNNSRSSNSLHVRGKPSKETSVRGIDGVWRDPHSCTSAHRSRSGQHRIPRNTSNESPKTQNAPQGAGRSVAVFVEKQFPLEVETTRFFNVNLWSAPPSVYTTFVVALPSIMHFGLTTRWTTNSTKQTAPRENCGEKHRLQCWTSGLHAVEIHWPVAGAFKVRVCEVSRAVRAIDITNRLQCLDVHAV